MNFKISSSKLVLAAVCAVTLLGCNSIKDVRDKPYTAVPPAQGLIAGTISGLGTRRAMVLSWSGAGNQDCQVPDPGNPAERLPAPCKFLGIEGQATQPFSFGSYDEGTAYNIKIESQPYGKICTVANASGTVGGTGSAPAITCVADEVNFPPRTNLIVNIPVALQTLPNMKITVSTEDGSWQQDATGLASVTFPKVLFNSGSNLPLFQYFVKATYQDTAGGDLLANSCDFTPSASFTSGGTNLDAAGGAVVPSAVADTNVSVRACAFTSTVSIVDEDAVASTGATGGLTLALRNHYTLVDEQTLPVANYTGQTLTSGRLYVNATLSFPTALKGNANSLYELVVTQQPPGKQCIVAGNQIVPADTQNTAQGVNTNINAPTGAAVAALDPAVPEWWTYANRQVRCKATPTGANVLTGTYQMDGRPGTQPNTDPARPYGRPREFLTFFDDGTFLYGMSMNTASNSANSPNATFPATTSGIIRGNYAASSGVIHGFYTYDSVAGTIYFNVLTATNINPSSRGLNGMPGYISPAPFAFSQPALLISPFTVVLSRGSITATNVVKGVDASNLGTLDMDFTGGTPSVTRHWNMTEPVSVPGEISGPWITADHQRVFVYDKNFTYAFHMGVNGYGNLQDACMLPLEDSTQSSGRLSLHADDAISGNIFVFVPTCTPGLLNFGANYVYGKNYDLPMDLPANTVVPNVIRQFIGPVPPTGLGPTTPRRPPNYHARFPGLTRQTDGRPSSPVDFAVTPGTPDTMTIQNTLNGNPIPNEPKLHWTKSTVN